MRILLYGEYWKGTHVDCISTVLQEKGIEFKIFDFFKILNPKTGNGFADKVLRRLVYSRNEKIINQLLCKEIELFKPDVLLISKGINIFPETLFFFSKRSIKIVNWNPDDFFNNNNASRHLLDSLGIYDYVFSSRSHLFEEYRTKGIRNPVYLEWYYIPWLHKRPAIVKPFQRKITFIGTHSKRRETIINGIDEKYPVEIWGSGWGFSNLRFKKNISLKDKVLPQSEFPQIMSESLINLNILTKENRDYTNLKLFEITASFGLLLTEHNEVTERLLEKNCFYYDADQTSKMNEAIERTFSPDQEDFIDDVRRQGYNHILSNEHAINNRVETIINVLKL